MSRGIKISAAVAAITIAASIGISVPSYAVQSHTEASTSSSHAAKTPYSDRDVVAFLATGSGRIASEFPQLLDYIPSQTSTPTSSQIAELTQVITRAAPGFHELVTVPLTSGNPYSVAKALNSYRVVVHSVTEKQGLTSNGVAVGDCVVVLAAGVLFVVAVATKFWVAAAASGDEGTEAFAAELAKTL